MNALSLIRLCASELTDRGIEDAEKEAELIVTSFARLDRTMLYRDNPAINETAEQSIMEAHSRRLRREPMAYILGSVDFRDLRIMTGPGVLVPRPETELIVDEVLKRYCSPCPGLHVLDLMTGSGCIALAVASALPQSDVTATDISEVALRYAKESAVLNGISNVTFLEGSMFEPVMHDRFDLILSNPPYIKSTAINTLQPEINDWEPREALDGGQDGLEVLRGILHHAPLHLTRGGYIMLELGSGQADSAASIAIDSGLETVSLVRDYAGIERILIARLSHGHKAIHSPC